MAVKARLKPPVYADQFNPLRYGGVEVVQIEDRPNDIALNPGQLNPILVDHILAQEEIRLLAVLLIGGSSEKSPLQGFYRVGQLDHNQLVDVLRFDRLRIWQTRLLQQPVVVPLVPSLLGAKQVAGAEQRKRKLILHRIYPAIGGE